MTRPGSLILTRADVGKLMAPSDWLAAVEAGFGASAEGRAHSAMPMHLDADGGAFHAKGASLRLDRLFVALKFNGNFPGNPGRGLPTIQGAILLCDGESGELLAVMDSIEVTLRRTAAATALAARYLAPPAAETVLICGCGEQGAAQLAALRNVLPLRRCFAWDSDAAKAEAFAERHGGGELEIAASIDLAPVAQESDVIVACTSARSPYLAAEMVRPGSFVAAVGADSPDKSEIEPELMRRSLVVADVLDQCAAIGDLRHAIAAGAMRREDVHAELAELVSGAKAGRTRDDQICLFDSTGTALQDVAAAALIYKRALGTPDLLSLQLGK